MDWRSRLRQRDQGEAVAVTCFEMMLGWTKKEAVPMGKSADVRNT